MKLAFCLFHYFPFGGLQRDYMRIAHECVRRGHSVQTYTMAWEGALDPALPVTLIPPRGWQNTSRIRHFSSRINNILSQHSYDLIVGFNKMPGLDIYYAADTCFQKKAREKHAYWYQYTPRYRHYIEFERAVFGPDKKTDILVLSQHQQSDFTEYYQTPASRFHLLPPGVSTDRIAPDNAKDLRLKQRQLFGIDANDFLLLMIGSGFKTKGLDRILYGIANLPDKLKNRAQLFVIGDDHQNAYLRQAKKLGIISNIRFLGGRTDIPAFLLAGDLLLHPAYNEAAGAVLLEAMVAGLPVLTTDVCGYASYIHDGNAGIVLPSPFSQTQFNKTLQTMLLSLHDTIWQTNARALAKTADIYDLPQHAVDIIESLGQPRVS